MIILVIEIIISFFFLLWPIVLNNKILIFFTVCECKCAFEFVFVCV